MSEVEPSAANYEKDMEVWKKDMEIWRLEMMLNRTLYRFFWYVARMIADGVAAVILMKTFDFVSVAGLLLIGVSYILSASQLKLLALKEPAVKWVEVLIYVFDFFVYGLALRALLLVPM